MTKQWPAKRKHTVQHTHTDLLTERRERERPTNRYRLTSFLLNPSSPTLFFFFSFLKKKNYEKSKRPSYTYPVRKRCILFRAVFNRSGPTSITHTQSDKKRVSYSFPSSFDPLFLLLKSSLYSTLGGFILFKKRKKCEWFIVCSGIKRNIWPVSLFRLEQEVTQSTDIRKPYPYAGRWYL